MLEISPSSANLSSSLLSAWQSSSWSSCFSLGLANGNHPEKMTKGKKETTIFSLQNSDKLWLCSTRGHGLEAGQWPG